MAWAASNGDRSENADYQYGKRRLREIDRRLGFLAHRMEIAEVVDPSILSGKRVVFGARVTVADEEDLQTTYQIVGEDEIQAAIGLISWRSPLASVLLGKTEGDEVILRKPSGEVALTIVLVEFPKSIAEETQQ